jgi:hypothetical protein
MRRPVPHAWTGTGFDRALLAHDRGTDQPNRAYEERTHAGDDTIREAEIGRTPPGAIEDQDLVLEEYGFGNHGPRRRDQPAGRPSPADAETGRRNHAPHNRIKIATSSETLTNFAIRHAHAPVHATGRSGCVRM